MKVNGKHTEFAYPITVSELIAGSAYREDRVAVELNGKIVPRTKYSETMLNDGDSVEIVGFVGGG